MLLLLLNNTAGHLSSSGSVRCHGFLLEVSIIVMILLLLQLQPGPRADHSLTANYSVQERDLL